LVVVSFLVSRFSYQEESQGFFTSDCYNAVYQIIDITEAETEADVCNIPNLLAGDENNPGPPDGWFMYTCCGICDVWDLSDIGN
jgi:hypothetical protein